MPVNQMPEAWKVTWDPEELSSERNMDTGVRTFPNENTARSLAAQLQMSGRTTVRLWHRPAQSIVSFGEVPL